MIILGIVEMVIGGAGVVSSAAYMFYLLSNAL